MKLRSCVKVTLLFISLVIVFISLSFIIHTMYKHDKANAIKKCGGKSNIVEKYTNQGDIYFICKD